jgi:methionine-rich copper-binding protein CopC
MTWNRIATGVPRRAFVIGAVVALMWTVTATAPGASMAAAAPSTRGAGAVPSATSASADATCPCSLFAPTDTPVTPDAGDASAVEVGVRFTPTTAGYVTGVRFYKSAANTGTHIGNLWTTSGALLATVVFTSETASGWQQATFSQPVPVAAGGTYIASYHTDAGHYAADFGYFATPVSNPPLVAPADGSDGNGVYKTGATGFPSSSYRSANYWVDLTFVTQATDTTPPTVVAQQPASNATAVPSASTPSATFSEPVQPSTVNFTLKGTSGATVPSSVAYDAASSTVTLTPTSSLADGTYTATVAGVKDLAGNAMAAPYSWSFSVGTRACPCSIWPATATPANPAVTDSTAVELGVQFSTDTPGYITGVRFYKADGNTGTHLGHVWTASGTLLGTATFTNESASGWQTATFTNPVAVAPGNVYVASYFAPNGHYEADGGALLNGVDSPPLHAMPDRNGTKNGVYHIGSSAFPADSWASINYWVDVVFATSAADTTPPTVASVKPPSGASGVPVNAPISATFSEPVQPSSVVIRLQDSVGHQLTGTTTYDADTLTSTFQPSAALDRSATYTATVQAAKDTAGNALAAPYVWSFTPSGTASLWGTPTPQVVDAVNSGPLELGMRFTSSTNGYVTGLRFYKSAANTGTHLADLWSVGGKLLGTATFTNETASGWQQVLFPQPVPISAGGTYVASYHTDSGHYSADPGYFADHGADNGPLHAFQDGDGGPNGVFADGASAFPTLTYGSANYWVDVVFTTTATDTTPPTVLTHAPLSGDPVPPESLITAGFSEPVRSSSISMTVTDASGHAVAGSTSYDAPSRVATFSPSSALSAGTTYTVKVSGAGDLAGNAMATPATWSFSTQTAVPLSGTGGPVLVITDPSNGFSDYYGEILRTEGLNEFATKPIASVTASTLANYDLVILTPRTVTNAQKSMLSSWVQGGGNLIAMRPSTSLASLFGLRSSGTTLAEGYLKVQTASGPGVGITDQTIQFHGTADRYTLNGATSVASLYRDATTATTSPAVAMRTYGTGHVAMFAFDLARSIVETRQGNIAWAGQHRMGTSPIRSYDLFYGPSASDPETNWLDLSKVAIPQADEQQRLLANLMITMDAAKRPLPRFNYFPKGYKAVVVMTGDDHAHGGTVGRFDQDLAESAPGCSVAQWTCLRSTSYIFPGTPISDAQAQLYEAAGFDLDAHVNTDCNDFTESSLDSIVTEELAALAAQLPSIPAPSNNSTHCVVWSDWASQPKVELAHGVRLDANYYWWPVQAAATHPGLFTGSGMPMRFADDDGSLIDVYQLATQVTDESGQPEPSTINLLLDDALGPLGYYGAFTINAHTDSGDSPVADAVVASAQARGVPVVSAKQMLTWLDAKAKSSFGNSSWSNGHLTFTVSADPGATGLQGMLPATSLAAPFSATSPGAITSLTVNGTAVPFTLQTIKGIQYAVFNAAGGTYTATYARSAP